MWGYHGEEGFYIGPSLEHYRCIKAYIPKSHAERDTDTATLIPNVVPIPESSIDDHIKATSSQLIQLLTRRKTPIGPFLPETTKDHLLTIAKLLHRDSTPSITTPVINPAVTSEGDKNISPQTTQLSKNLSSVEWSQFHLKI